MQDTRIEVPTSRRELANLDVLRRELRTQLNAATEDRREATKFPPIDQSRVATLNARIGRLEAQVQSIDDAIATAMARGVNYEPRASTSVPPQGMMRGEDVGGIVASLTMTFVIVGIVLWKWAGARARRKFARPAAGDSGRLDQLQSAVDVIALEVERISESQRYVTKLLNEKLQSALGAGEAQPLSMNHGVPEPSDLAEKRHR